MKAALICWLILSTYALGETEAFYRDLFNVVASGNVSFPVKRTVFD